MGGGGQGGKPDRGEGRVLVRVGTRLYRGGGLNGAFMVNTPFLFSKKEESPWRMYSM